MSNEYKKFTKTPVVEESLSNFHPFIVSMFKEYKNNN